MRYEESAERVPISTLLKVLDRWLIDALWQFAFKFALSSNSIITVEIYLAALYSSSPAEVGRFFESAEPLTKMLHELRDNEEESPASNILADQRGLTFVRFDKKLAQILWQTARISQASGNPAHLADVMNVMRLDDQITGALQKDRNLVLRLPQEG